MIFDHTERTGEKTIIIDDMTGCPSGIPLNEDLKQRLKAAGIGLVAPTRGENGLAGDFQKPGTLRINVEQQDYFLNVAAKVVLPAFKERGKPFMLVFWSRDPDGTQHNQGDSLNRLLPGVYGPTSLAAIHNADHDLAEHLSTLKALGLDETTDVIIASDHGFSAISKESASSFAAAQTYKDVVPHFLPVGFVAIDLALGHDLPLFDPDAQYAPGETGTHPLRGDGLIGGDRVHPKVVVATNVGRHQCKPLRLTVLAARLWSQRRRSVKTGISTRQVIQAEPWDCQKIYQGILNSHNVEVSLWLARASDSSHRANALC